MTDKAARINVRPKFTVPVGTMDKATRDGFVNFAARLGIGADNLISGSTYQPDFITRNRQLVEWMYRASWIVGRGVDCIAEDMVREGFQLTSVVVPSDIETFQVGWNELQLSQALTDTIRWARLYGGAVAIPMIDGQDTTTPLDLDKIGKGQFKGLLVVDRWSMQPTYSTLVKDLGPDIGRPEFYDILPGQMGLPGWRVHYSRILRFDGVKLPYNQRLVENYWSLSIVERIWDRIVAFDSVSAGAAQLAFRAHLRVLSIEGYRNVIAAGGSTPGQNILGAVMSQISMMRYFQSNESITVIDAKDKMEMFTQSFTGLPDLMLRFAEQIAGALNTPLVRMFGMTPGGLNASGDSDLKHYEADIKARQEADLRGPLNKVIGIHFRSTFGKPPPDGFNFKFNPLWPMSAQDKSEQAYKVTDTVVKAVDSGLVKPATGLKELKQSSAETGIWSNIDDEEIEEAEALPPTPEEVDPLTGKPKVTNKETTTEPESGTEPASPDDPEFKE